MCKTKYFICDPVLVTKKMGPLQAKIKYQSAHNNNSYLSKYNYNQITTEINI